tara:strand:- start:131 stop:394 length:264 start_codon:yes stop_codon:yes gene_type:complete
MDDGSVSWSPHRDHVNSLAIHSEGFSEGENRLLSEWFESQWGLEARVRPSKGYFYLYFPREAAGEFLNLVASFIHPSMRYKLDGQIS